MKPLVQPANHGGDGANDKDALGEQAQTLTASGTLLGHGQAAGMANG